MLALALALACLWKTCAPPLTLNLEPVPQVPEGQKVRVKFTMFRMKEPGVDTRACNKDYVEVMGVK